MAFHRLTVPAYYGGLPGGYDYINNAIAGTPALGDGARADSGPNDGTYFIGFGENVRSIVVNRGLKALADNTDLLDDYLHRGVAVPARTTNVTAGAPVSSIIITGPDIFLGAAGTPNTTEGFNTFLQLLDNEDKEIVNASLVKCEITAVSGGTIGAGGFSAGNVTLTISPAIPGGVTYRVYYGTRGNLATLPVDAFLNIKVRSAQEVSALLEVPGGSELIGYNGGAAWADATTNLGPTTVGAQLDKILTDIGSTGGSDKVGYASGGLTWADTAAFSPSSAGIAIDTIVSDLAASTGTQKVGGAASAGTVYSLPAGTLRNQLTTLNTNLDTTAVAVDAIEADLIARRVEWRNNWNQIPALCFRAVESVLNIGTHNKIAWCGRTSQAMFRRWLVCSDANGGFTRLGYSSNEGWTWGDIAGAAAFNMNTYDAHDDPAGNIVVDS